MCVHRVKDIIIDGHIKYLGTNIGGMEKANPNDKSVKKKPFDTNEVETDCCIWRITINSNIKATKDKQCWHTKYSRKFLRGSIFTHHAGTVIKHSS